MPPKKSAKVSLVTSGTEDMGKKVEDFLFLPQCNVPPIVVNKIIQIENVYNKYMNKQGLIWHQL